MTSQIIRWFATSSLALILAACGGSSTGSDVASGDVAIDASRDVATTDTMDAAVDVVSDTPMMMADSGCHSPADVYDPFCDPTARSPATPLTAPSATWTWIPFPDAICLNGSATGIAVNLAATPSPHVMIYFEGGGACWDALTCYQLATAANVGGYDASTFAGELPGVQSAPFFDRTDANNPWRDANYVFVPYCSGDVFSGDAFEYLNNDGTLEPTFFEGYRNIGVFLTRIVPTFTTATRVWLSGSSAGGFGAAVNWERVQTAFGSTRVDLVDDSGPPVATTRFPLFDDAWHIQFPAGCTACGSDFTALMNYYGSTLATGHRLALLSYTMDGTISSYFGLTASQFETELDSAATGSFDPTASMKYFFVDGTSHTMLPTMDAVTGPTGTPLTTWLQQMVSDDPAWASEHP